ncbi:hypothetical protein [Glutamicibacter sp. NPDC087344]|uniref:hypothetical protein n=1 Tax=Glutamicibacter sp. NPDC087344 TaxID=3363994 RepID=UPI003814818C
MPERFQQNFHPEYSRLDHESLLKTLLELDPAYSASSMRERTRPQLISLIQEAERFANLEPSDMPQPDSFVPLPRLAFQNYELPKTLEPGQGMYYCWEDKDSVIDAAISLAKGDVSTREWNLGEDVPEGSLLLTVLGTTPPLVTALETVTTVTEEKVYVEQVAVFADPVSLYEIESLIDSGLPRSSKPLSIQIGKRVLKALAKMLKNPTPVVISAGQCQDGADPYDNDAVHVLALLQRDYDDIPLCDGCGRDVDSETAVHFFRPNGENLSWEIQDHVEDAGLLCVDCHTVVHGPTKARLRKLVGAGPSCPECGHGNPREALWGEPSIIPNDKYAVMGCVLPPEPLAEWVCRNCDTPYAVVAHPENLYFGGLRQSMSDTHEPETT